MLVIVLLLIVGAVVGIMCLKKKQNQRKVVVSLGAQDHFQGDDSVDRHLLLMARESLRCMIVSLSFFTNFSVWLL